MAAGLLHQLCSASFEVHSAGFEQAKPSPLVCHVMSESGVDLSDTQTKLAPHLLASGITFDIVITLSDEIRAECDRIVPFPARRLHWSFLDPSDFHGSHEYKLCRVRDVRDALKAAIEAWCARVCPTSAAYEIMFKPFYSQKLNEPSA